MKTVSALSKITAGLLGGAALWCAPAVAADLSYKDAPAEHHGAGRTLAVTGYAALTTDYIFRGISQSSENPAVQAQMDLTYGIFYTGVFASSIDFDVDDASLEIDVYAGIKPTWNGVTFDLGVIYYAYPGSDNETFGGDLDYVELKAGISGTILNRLNAYANLFFTDDSFGEIGQVITVEGGLSASLFKYRDIDFTLGGAIGFVEYDKDDKAIFIDGALFGVFELEDYTYYNIGLTATKGRFSVDVRYHDTDASDDTYNCGTAAFQCDERVVATGKITF
jgi:uncharacterized protein (TIGR02001 family)